MTLRDYYRDPTLRVDADALEKMQAFQIKAGFKPQARRNVKLALEKHGVLDDGALGRDVDEASPAPVPADARHGVGHIAQPGGKRAG